MMITFSERIPLPKGKLRICTIPIKGGALKQVRPNRLTDPHSKDQAVVVIARLSAEKQDPILTFTQGSTPLFSGEIPLSKVQKRILQGLVIEVDLPSAQPTFFPSSLTEEDIKVSLATGLTRLEIQQAGRTLFSCKYFPCQKKLKKKLIQEGGEVTLYQNTKGHPALLFDALTKDLITGEYAFLEPKLQLGYLIGKELSVSEDVLLYKGCYPIHKGYFTRAVLAPDQSIYLQIADKIYCYTLVD